MKVYCRIENGVVVNRAVFDDEIPAGWADPNDTWVPSDVAQIGWTYDAGAFTAPVAPPPSAPIVPQSVTPYQARKALNDAGLRSAVEDAVNAASQDVQDAWHYAVAVERNSPMIAALGASLGLTEAQIDDLFRAAAAAV